MKKEMLIFSMIFLFSVSFVLGAETKNITSQEDASLCINQSQKVVENLALNNFSIARANDTLKQAENLYYSQILLMQRSRTPDFSLVLPHCDNLVSLQKNAFNSRDAFIALKKFYSESFNEGFNASSVEVIINQIEEEMISERYENVPDLINSAYEEIINVKSESTTLNLFYQSTSRSVKKFLVDHWISLSTSLIVLVVLFFVYQASIHRWLIKRKIENLQARKESLRNLIMKTQKEYFEGGMMSESNYTLRTKSFAEMIRDIDRQIPLLQERLFIYSGGRSREEAKYAKQDEKIKEKEKIKHEKHVIRHEKKINKILSKQEKMNWKEFKKTHKKVKKAHKETFKK
jgi:hypothetical protein